jgi:hypothetical protein
MIKEFGKKATNKIIKLMIEIEARDETLEVQEELIRLERAKTVGLEKSLSKKGRFSRCKRTFSKLKLTNFLSLKSL